MVSAEESLTHLWASKLGTGPNIFVVIMEVAPGQPLEFPIFPFLYKEEKKNPDHRSEYL